MASEHIKYYQEPLTAEEMAYVIKKVERERRRFYKVVRALLILCFVIPFVMSWKFALDNNENPFHPITYFGWVAFLMCFSSIPIGFSYRTYLYKIEKDKRKGDKTVELTHLTRKVFVNETGTYHFYIDSPTRLSVEVKEEDYSKVQVGDELNIEYTTFAQDYLGYF